MIGKWLRRYRRWPPIGQVDFGALRALTPVGRCAPGSLGALDRSLIEEFLAEHAADIAGRVLEEGGGGFAIRYGGSRVTACAPFDVGDAGVDHGRAPADLDCILLPGALHRVDEPRALLRTLHRLLRPGGVMLATMAGAAQRTDGATCWRFTPYSAQLLFAEAFGAQSVTLKARGNVLIALAHAHRLPASELAPESLRVDDPAFPFMVGVRAVRQRDA